MSLTNIPLLSKTRFIGGLQCLKRLYLESHHRELIPPVDPAQQALFDSGNEVGQLAREIFPGGVLIQEDNLQHKQAVLNTKTQLDDPSVEAIYEAAFTFDDIRTRVDILKRIDENSFVLGEVKSSTGVKAEHIPDAAVQVYVVEGSGVEIKTVYLIHINNRYEYEGGDYDLGELFTLEDITPQVREYLYTMLQSNLGVMREALSRTDPPDIDTGKHCKNPYRCPFFSHCRQDFPTYSIEELPGARAELLDDLKSHGIRDISKISPGFPKLTSMQSRVRESVISGNPYVNPKISEIVSDMEYPFMHMDFETFMPALPHYPGTHPYQVIPFQWSIHIQKENGVIEHQEFLFEGYDDPREAFLSTLIDAAGDTGSIVTYSNYEDTQLKKLAEQFPEYQGQVSLLRSRIFDLLKAVRQNYYHPHFHGSFSLKSVVPALVPDVDYKTLEIQEGGTAAVSYARLVSKDTDISEKQRIRNALLEYCKMDTFAMVRLLQTLTDQSS